MPTPHQGAPMSMIVRSAVRALSITALLAGTAAAAAAQGASPLQILSRYNKAIDPAGKLSTLEGVRTVGTMEMPAAGVSAQLEAAQRRPNQMIMTITLAGLGQIRQGFDGTTAWSSDPMGGPRILTEAETAQIKDGADFRSMGRDTALFASIESAGETQLDGEATDCVKLTWKTQRVTTECYSRTSGLLLESRSKNASPQGEIETVTRMYDYKPVAGVMMSHKMVNQMMGATQTITWTTIEAGPLDAKLFELPQEIKALKAP
jgi:hypothetical protein